MEKKIYQLLNTEENSRVMIAMLDTQGTVVDHRSDPESL